MSDVHQETIRGVTRAVIRVSVGARESVEFTVPREAVLRVSVGVSEPNPARPAVGITASIATCGSPDTRSLASVHLIPRRETRDWTDLDLDLSGEAGRALKLCFIASPDNDEVPLPPADAATVWFGNPIVRSRGFIDNPRGRPNLIVITLDTTRADHLSSAGYSLPTTPSLDRLAADGEQFLNAIAIAPWTLPSHASLFTGLYPREHGARGDPEGDIVRLWRLRGLSPQALTLAEQLAAAGYHTAAVVGGPMVGKEFGFAQGFDYYDQGEYAEEDLNHRRGHEITDVALRWVSKESAPFFLFLNYFDAHWPYKPDDDLMRKWVPAGVAPIAPERQGQIWKEVLGGQRDVSVDEKQSMVTHYDGAVASMDRAIGRLVAGLKERGLYDQTMIVAVSDHGESFGEHRMLDHGHSLYEDVLRAALIIKYPKGQAVRPPKVSTQRVGLLDVYATMCREMGLPLPVRLEGFGVDRTAHDQFAELERNAFYIFQYGPRFDRDLETVYRDRWKLIRDDKGQRWLFDLATDPIEELDLAEARPEQVAALGEALDAWTAASVATRLPEQAVDPNPQLEERLRALGYIGD